MAIDFLRGIAVLAVVNDHWQDSFKELKDVKSLSFIQSFFDYCGWVGVDLFFVLSGFLVSGLLFKEYRKTGAMSPGRFLVRRGFKIYPGFYCLLFFIAGLTLLRDPHAFHWPRFLAEGLFVQNYFEGIFGHTWSLAVEEHFYLSLAFVLFLLSKTTILNRRSLFLRLGFGTILLVFSMRLVNALLSPTASISGTDFTLGSQYHVTHLRLDGLLFGVMLSYLYHFENARLLRFCQRWRIPMILLGLLIVLLVAPWLNIQTISLYPSNGFWLGTIGFTLLYFAWGGVLMGAIALPARVWNNAVGRIVAWVGFYSYSIYLWHLFIAATVIKGVAALRLTNYPHLMMLVYSILAVLGGYLAAKAVEMPMLALRDRLFPRKT